MQAIPTFQRPLPGRELFFKHRSIRRLMHALCAGIGVASLLAAEGAGTCFLTMLPPSSPLLAQVQGKARPLKQQPQAELSVTKSAYSPEGILVLCVRITAKDKDVELGTPGDANTSDASFTMEGSYLENQNTKERINALAELPNTPNYGPMALLSQVLKGNWLELGVAFPRLPAPKDPAKPDTYKLYIPLKAEPIDVKDLPAAPPPKAGAKPKAAGTVKPK